MDLAVPKSEYMNPYSKTVRILSAEAQNLVIPQKLGF